MDKGNSAGSALPPRAVNDDMRRAAANLATIIRECGLSQSELSRRSGLSRQLINAWARQRVPVSLSATVGSFLSVIQLTVADLLLHEQALYDKLGKVPRGASEPPRFLQRLARFSESEEARKRRRAIDGVFRYRTRLKESPTFIIERTFQFETTGDNTIVRAFNGLQVGSNLVAEGVCFLYPSIFFVFIECADPPHQPMVYAYHDPKTPRITSLKGVSIAPALFGRDQGLPLTRLVYMHRLNADGSVIEETRSEYEREFNTFIPPDAETVLTTF
jgi:transcriptional regulator with XRE-family HTH domain